MIELERTFLAKYIPEGLHNSPSREIVDLYFPKSNPHPKLRIRKIGDKIEMTKKKPIDNDVSQQIEQTIELSEAEFKELTKLDCHKTEKTRYYYEFDGKKAEIDVFHGKLEGLVMADFEFDEISEKDSFQMPDFCLADVTQDEFTAGGILCQRIYADIEKDLKRFGYKKLPIKEVNPSK